jgi:hypothetical protein
VVRCYHVHSHSCRHGCSGSVAAFICSHDLTNL